MAKKYFEKLSNLVDQINLENETRFPIEIKHLFTGAALYVNNSICASWSPGGLAFKLTEQEASKLISADKAIPLKYFPKGHIKKDYALFESPELKRPSHWKTYFNKAIKLNNQ